MHNLNRDFRPDTDAKTKDTSLELIQLVIPVLFPKWTFAQHDERFASGDAFFNTPYGEVGIECEARDAESDETENRNWKRIIRGEFASLNIPARKNPIHQSHKKYEWSYYIAFDYHDQNDFVMFNIDAFNHYADNKVIRGESFHSIPIKFLYFGKLDVVGGKPVIITKPVNRVTRHAKVHISALDNPPILREHEPCFNPNAIR